MDDNYEALCSQLDKLRNENSDLRMMLDIVRENYELQSKLSTQRPIDVTENKGRKMTLRWQDTMEEGRFNNDQPNTSLKESAPLTIQSLEKVSSLKKIQKEQFVDSAQLSLVGKVPSEFKKLERLVGEVAFQLERRILFYVFPGQSRLYGFTVLNIPEKILQISKHSLTGKVDEDYRYDLSQRHLELMDKLRLLGYSAPIHAPFAESIVNTYGILKQRPDSYSAEELGYNNPEFLRNIVIKMAPSKFLKDLLCLLSCLCFMARQDNKPLFLW
ncbi:speriolin-like protein [Conger conger]|uniref:speriolin-like protein n=1 Tax=Conger conger TaxID=82655 RepID=UPI002A59B576|nr:speriolin-like protein [Conger conger]